MIDSVAQNLLLSTSKYLQAKEYWLTKLSGELEKTGLALEYRTDNREPAREESLEITIPVHICSKLMSMSKKQEISLYIILLTVFKTLIYRYTGNEDVMIGSPVYQSTVTSETFNELVVIRDSVNGDLTFKEFLLQVRQTTLEAYENQDYPFEKIWEYLDMPGGELGPTFFNVICLLKNIHREIPVNRYHGEMVLVFEYAEDLIKGQVLYDSSVIDVYLIQQLADHFLRVLESVLENTQIKLGELRLVSEQETQRILVDFNRTTVKYPNGKTVNELFEAQVEKNPIKVAVIFEGHQLTYEDLNKNANRLANKLRRQGVRPDQIVGLIVERSSWLLCGILGILKAGGAYLPIDPDCPRERQKLLLTESGVELLVTQDHLMAELEFNGTIISLNERELQGESFLNLNLTNKPENLAYVIYTSGSTGQPKGVLVEHRNMVAYVYAFNREFNLSGDTIMLQQASYTFDAFVEEVFPVLFCGGSLVVAGKNDLLDLHRLMKLINDHQVNIISCTPLLLNEFNKMPPVKSVRTYISGGDLLKNEYISNLLREATVYNTYGPTETTVCASYYRRPPDELKTRIPIGKPIANYRIYILDRYLQPQPVGRRGELCIGGAGVSRGYLNNPEQNSARFVPDPFLPGEKIYKTGDMARWLPDGNIEYLGRSDYQVKIRGYRIELGEVEAALAKHPAVKMAVVIDREDESGEKYLCAYLTGNENLSVNELREYLYQKLPDYMVPSHFVKLKRIPVNPSGKIDRKALPAPKIESEEYTAPADPFEEKLVEIWQNVLGVKRIGVNDNFFEIGGHSLKATIMLARIHKELNIEVPIWEIFNTPTIRGISGYIRDAEETKYDSIKPAAVQDYYPLSSAQKRLFILNQFENIGTSYNMPMVFWVEGNLDCNRLEIVMKQLIARHETLRTSFNFIDGNPVQIIHPEVEFKIEIQNLEEPQVNEAIQQFIRPFDLKRGPLLRIKIIMVKPGLSVLLFDMHHIIADGVGMALLIRDFVDLYEGKVLSELKVQYKDYAVWQSEQVAAGKFEKQEKYWLNMFRDEVPVLNMPTDYPRPSFQSFEGDDLYSEIGPDLTASLNRLVKETGTTLYMILLATFNILLSKYSGQEEIVVGTPIAGRPHADLEKIIGLFINTLAMRNCPAGDKSFMKFLVEVKQNTLATFENQDYQLEELLNKLGTPRDLSRNPLFDTIFALDNIDFQTITIGDLRFTPYEMEFKTSKVDFTLDAQERKGRIELRLEYCTGLFKKETMERMLGHFQNILKSITVNPRIRLDEIDMLTQTEKDQILYKFNKMEIS